MNDLFLLNLQIGHGRSEMPTHLAGAFVAVYVAAVDHEAALAQAVARIQARGYEFIDLADGKVHQLDPLKWDDYVERAWPEFAAHFPTQAEVMTGLRSSDWVCFGPFAAYEPSTPD